MELSQRALDELMKLTPARFKFLIYLTNEEQNYFDEGSGTFYNLVEYNQIKASLDTKLNINGLESIVDWLLESEYISEINISNPAHNRRYFCLEYLYVGGELC